MADDISDSSLLGKGFVCFVFVWFMSRRLTTINWTTQINGRKETKSRTFFEKKGNSLSWTSSCQGVKTLNELVTVILLHELTSQIRVHTYFSYRWRLANIHHTINERGTQRILCVLLAGYPNKTIKYYVKGLNHCLLFSTSNCRHLQRTLIFFTKEPFKILFWYVGKQHCLLYKGHYVFNAYEMNFQFRKLLRSG